MFPPRGGRDTLVGPNGEVDADGDQCFQSEEIEVFAVPDALNENDPHSGEAVTVQQKLVRAKAWLIDHHMPHDDDYDVPMGIFEAVCDLEKVLTGNVTSQSASWIE